MIYEQSIVVIDRLKMELPSNVRFYSILFYSILFYSVTKKGLGMSYYFPLNSMKFVIPLH